MKYFQINKKYTPGIFLLILFLISFGWATANSSAEGRLSVWGGFFYTDAISLSGFSDGTSAPINLPIRTVFRPDPDQGWFGGVSIGSALKSSVLSFQQIELFFEGQITEQDSDSITTIGVGSIPFVTGLAVGLGPVPLTALAERQRYEIGVTLSDFEGEGDWQSFQITPFAGFGSEHAVSTAVLGGFGLTTNTSDLDWRFTGILAGSKQVFDIGNGFDLVFEGAVGPYYYDAGGKVAGRHTIGASNASISGNGIGIRAKAMIELRKLVSKSVEFSLFGGVDFWSDTPYSRMQDPSIWNSGVPLSVETASTTDWRVGVKMTLKLGDQ